MVDVVAIQIPKLSVKEGSSFVATAFFREDGDESIPTNIYYRIDNLTTNESVQDWTSVSAAADITINVTSTNNALSSQCHRTERLQLTVDADHGLSTQVRESATWDVVNVGVV